MFSRETWVWFGGVLALLCVFNAYALYADWETPQNRQDPDPKLEIPELPPIVDRAVKSGQYYTEPSSPRVEDPDPQEKGRREKELAAAEVRRDKERADRVAAEEVRRDKERADRAAAESREKEKAEEARREKERADRAAAEEVRREKERADRAAAESREKEKAEEARRDKERAERATAEAREKEKQYQDAMKRGIEAYGKKDYPEAVKEAEAALAARPGDSKANDLREIAQKAVEVKKLISEGRAALERRKFPEAMANAEKALKLDPDHQEARRLLEASKPLKGRVLVVVVATDVPCFDDLDAQMKDLKVLCQKQKKELVGGDVQVIAPRTGGGLEMACWGQQAGTRFKTAAYTSMLQDTFAYLDEAVLPRVAGPGGQNVPVVLIWLTNKLPTPAEANQNPVPKNFQGRIRVVYYHDSVNEDSKAVVAWFGTGFAARPGNFASVGPWAGEYVEKLP